MIAVADASPINYLVQIELDYLLPLLYERVLLPADVLRELNDRGAPEEMRKWVQNTPEWLSVKDAPWIPSHELDQLDGGERAAISLAKAESAGVLLMDERLATGIARRMGLGSGHAGSSRPGCSKETH